MKYVSDEDAEESYYLAKLSFGYILMALISQIMSFVMLFKNRLRYSIAFFVISFVAFRLAEKYKRQSDKLAGIDTRWRP